jgi:hypothetical protein
LVTTHPSNPIHISSSFLLSPTRVVSQRRRRRPSNRVRRRQIRSLSCCPGEHSSPPSPTTSPSPDSDRIRHSPPPRRRQPLPLPNVRRRRLLSFLVASMSLAGLSLPAPFRLSARWFFPSGGRICSAGAVSSAEAVDLSSQGKSRSPIMVVVGGDYQAGISDKLLLPPRADASPSSCHTEGHGASVNPCPELVAHAETAGSSPSLADGSPSASSWSSWGPCWVQADKKALNSCQPLQFLADLRPTAAPALLLKVL